MSRFIYGHEKIGTTQGPWQCDECKQQTCYTDVGTKINRIYCVNCGFLRIIDKAAGRICENDGTQWLYDSKGNKTRVRGI